MKNSYPFIAMVILIIFSCIGCKKKNETTTPTLGINRTITGSAQKGPFLNGSSIAVYELNQNYSQTGKVFNTQISDNTGSFQLIDIPLITNYVQIRADGFYFNEVCGSNSISQLTLNCIADIGSSGSLHVNLLTHLEKPRVAFLLSEGMPFDSAKKEAQREVLNIFNISLTGIQNSEFLDISQSGDGNAILLAISSILQGFRSESELSSLLSLLSNDIRSDGILNDTNVMSSIIDHAILLDTVSIRNNVSIFYQNLGINASIPHFETYIQQFINNSIFPRTNSVISYPVSGLYGDNLLLKNQLIYNGTDFSMTAGLKKCSQLTIRMHLISGGIWAYALGTNHNLNITPYDSGKNEQFFTVIDPDLPFDLHIHFPTGGTYLIEYYEITLSTPSFSKTITVS